MPTVFPLDRADEPEFVEIRRADRPFEARDFEEPLPDWLDLLLCIALPILLALVVTALFQLPHLAAARP